MQCKTVQDNIVQYNIIYFNTKKYLLQYTLLYFISVVQLKYICKYSKR